MNGENFSRQLGKRNINKNIDLIKALFIVAKERNEKRKKRTDSRHNFAPSYKQACSGPCKFPAQQYLFPRLSVWGNPGSFWCKSAYSLHKDVSCFVCFKVSFHALVQDHIVRVMNKL